LEIVIIIIIIIIIMFLFIFLVASFDGIRPLLVTSHCSLRSLPNKLRSFIISIVIKVVVVCVVLALAVLGLICSYACTILEKKKTGDPRDACIRSYNTDTFVHS